MRRMQGVKTTLLTAILNLLVAFDSSNNVHLRYFVVLDKTQILLKD